MPTVIVAMQVCSGMMENDVGYRARVSLLLCVYCVEYNAKRARFLVIVVHGAGTIETSPCQGGLAGGGSENLSSGLKNLF